MKDRLILMSMKYVNRQMMRQYHAVQTGGKTKWAKANGGKKWKRKKWYSKRGMVNGIFRRNGKRIPYFSGDPVHMFCGYALNTIGHNKKWTGILRRTAFKYAYKFLIPRLYVKLKPRFSKRISLADTLDELMHVMDTSKAAKELLFPKKAAILKRAVRRLARLAKLLYKKFIKHARCRVCAYFRNSHSRRIAKEMAAGKMPKEIYHDDLFNLQYAVESLERANFHFNNAFDVGFGMLEYLKYLRHFKPLLQKGLFKTNTIGRWPDSVGGPLRPLGKGITARSVWKSDRFSPGNMGAFSCVSPFFCNTVMARPYVMTHVPFMLDFDDTVHINKGDATWVYRWFDKYLPRFLRGHFLELAAEMASGFRMSGKKENNSQEVCWTTTMIMSLHRGNGRFRPLSYRGGPAKDAHTVSYGRFHWTWEAIDGMRDRVGTDKKYEKHVHKILQRAHFSKQSHSVIYDHRSLRGKLKKAWKMIKSPHGRMDFSCNLYARLHKLRNVHKRVHFLKLEPPQQIATKVFIRIKSMAKRRKFARFWYKKCVRYPKGA